MKCWTEKVNPENGRWKKSRTPSLLLLEMGRISSGPDATFQANRRPYFWREPYRKQQRVSRETFESETIKVCNHSKSMVGKCSSSFYDSILTSFFFGHCALEGIYTVFKKIISGGQTGVDRAALDVALELGIPLGGWCPKGRRAEDGTIPDSYPLQETSSSDYRVRTEKNVEDSDGTLILTWGSPTGGTALTLKLAKRHHKPYFLVNLAGGGDSENVKRWGQATKIHILNVAGPREGEAPGIHDRAVAFLRQVLEDPLFLRASKS